jgi:hypothetical protein
MKSNHALFRVISFLLLLYPIYFIIIVKNIKLANYSDIINENRKYN